MGRVALNNGASCLTFGTSCLSSSLTGTSCLGTSCLWPKLSVIQKNTGHFGPIPVKSGSFGRISGASHLCPAGAGPFGPVLKVGQYGPTEGASRFSLIYLFSENR